MTLLRAELPTGHLLCDPALLERFKKIEAKQVKDPKRKRGYHRIMSGMEKAAKLGVPLYRIDLTSKEFNEPKMHTYLQTLRKRIARHYRKNIVYVSIKAKGDKGGKTHLHIVYWVQTLNKKPIYELSKAWISKYWLSWNWRDITGNIITFIKVVKGQAISRKKVCNYFIGQYFSGQNHYERMSWSTDWLFKGAVTLWKTYFSPDYYGSGKAATLDSWVYRLVNPTSIVPLPNG